MSKFSIIVPSLGDPILLNCLLDSLVRTASRNYQVCIGYDATVYKHPSLPLIFPPYMSTSAKSPGMSAAMNAAFSITDSEWIVWVCDDMVFLPGWDRFPPLREDRAVCFSLIQPEWGSFPPTADAGDSPSNFRRSAADTENLRRQIAAYGTGVDAQPGNFFGSAVFHRSRWVPWPEWPDPYSCNDIAWYWKTHLAHPDLVFGNMPGNCLYHFVRGSVRSRPELQPDGEAVGRAFREQYGLTIQDAYNLIDARSEALW